MGTRSFFIIIGFLIPTFCLAQPTEEQRKYALPDTLAEYALLQEMNGAAGCQTRQHSAYRYTDIYLDTPDEFLLEMGYSLRMRRRILSDGTRGYSMQLKSEMLDSTAVRIEVEEKELDFYQTILTNGVAISLPRCMDSLMEWVSQRGIHTDQSAFNAYKGMVENWLASHVNAPITPFQYLKFAHPEVFTEDVLSSLKVQLIGHSYRIRGHVYFNSSRENLYGIEFIPRKGNELPPFFIENPEAIWMLETSLDYAQFYDADSIRPAVHVREFEVENKYPVSEACRQVFDAFEAALIAEFRIQVERDSKHVQVKNALQKQ